MEGGQGLEALRSDAAKGLENLQEMVKECNNGLQAAFSTLGGELTQMSALVREKVSEAGKGLVEIVDESNLVFQVRQSQYKLLDRARKLLDLAEETRAGKQALQGEITDLGVWVEELEGIYTEVKGLRSKAPDAERDLGEPAMEMPDGAKNCIVDITTLLRGHLEPTDLAGSVESSLSPGFESPSFLPFPPSSPTESFLAAAQRESKSKSPDLQSAAAPSGLFPPFAGSPPQLSRYPMAVQEAATQCSHYARSQLRPLEMRLRSAVASALSILPLDSGLQVSPADSSAVMMSKLCIYVATVSLSSDGAKKAIHSRGAVVPEMPLADVLRLANILLDRLETMLQRFSCQETVLRDVLATKVSGYSEAIARHSPVLEVLEFLCSSDPDSNDPSAAAGAPAAGDVADSPNRRRSGGGESGGGDAQNPTRASLKQSELFSLLDDATKLSKDYRSRKFALAAWEQYVRLPDVSSEAATVSPEACYSQLLGKMASLSASYDEILSARQTSDVRLLERAAALESRLVNYGIAAGELGTSFRTLDLQGARKATEELASRLRAATSLFISSLTSRINDCLLDSDRDGVVPSFFSAGSDAPSKIPEHISSQLSLYLSEPGKLLTEWTALGEAILGSEVFSALPALLSEIAEVKKEISLVSAQVAEYASRVALPSLVVGDLLPRLSGVEKLAPMPEMPPGIGSTLLPSEFRDVSFPSLAAALSATTSFLSMQNAREEGKTRNLRAQSLESLIVDLLGAATKCLDEKRKHLDDLQGCESELDKLVRGEVDIDVSSLVLSSSAREAIQAYNSARSEHVSLLQRLQSSRDAVDKSCSLALEAISSVSSSVQTAISRVKDRISALRSGLSQAKKQETTAILMKWIVYCEGRICSRSSAEEIQDATRSQAPSSDQDTKETTAPSQSAQQEYILDLTLATQALNSVSEFRPKLTIPTIIRESDQMLQEVEQLQDFVERNYPDYSV